MKTTSHSERLFSDENIPAHIKITGTNYPYFRSATSGYKKTRSDDIIDMDVMPQMVTEYRAVLDDQVLIGPARYISKKIGVCVNTVQRVCGKQRQAKSWKITKTGRRVINNVYRAD